MNSENVCVRFPPSPTGYLHIGGARTALFNWLFCRQKGGRFVLRIEDTDAERSTEASAQAILDGLRWMGVDWDEGPYLQTQYAGEHRAAAERLVDKGAAYRCYCTPAELAERREAAEAAKLDYGYDGTCRHLTPEERAAREAEGRSWVVRFRVPEDGGELAFDDMVYGHHAVQLRELEDFVIVRSNGQPLYILSNAVDDHRDGVSHVIRGADHLRNTFKQILLYEAMGWDVPTFGHISLTLDTQKAKISKRKHGEVVAVDFYQKAGFLPSAFCNFVALLGWSPGDDREVFLTREELLDAFSSGGLSKTHSVFNWRPGDPKFITDPKALHINAQHLRALPLDELGAHVRGQLEAEGLWQEAWAEGGAARDWFLATLDLIRVRYHLLTDFVTLGRAYFGDDFEIDPKAMKKGLCKDPALIDHLPRLAARLEELEVFDLETTEAALRVLCEELGVKAGLLINAARAAVSGQAVGPGIFDLFCAVGQRRTVERLRRAVDLITATD